ncbi:MAG: class I SAM-dependent methyltransferase [Oscillospiraceae bacterium]|nr:class I SAM-dependent methyltransferase [Oscillospiraceae bacterium]
MNNHQHTHAGKAVSYDLGRPEYPDDFFDYLYNEIGFQKADTVMDIGCGTGKITRRFLERGSRAVAIEPDGEMLALADQRLQAYPDYVSFQRTAEATGVDTSSVDHVFCGNSYHWFEREKVISELRRILRPNGLIVIATLGGGSNPFDGEQGKISEAFKRTVPRGNPDVSPPFREGAFTEKIFFYTVHETFDELLHGYLSTSFMPSPGDAEYDLFSEAVRDLFHRYQNGGTLAAAMRLHCVIGRAENLI